MCQTLHQQSYVVFNCDIPTKVWSKLVDVFLYAMIDGGPDPLWEGALLGICAGLL